MARQGMDSYHEASSSGAKGSKKLDHILIRPTKNKGHVVEHHYSSQHGDVFMHRPDVHAFGEGPEVIRHLAKHLKVDLSDMGTEANVEDEHEGMDTERPGGKPDHEVADSEPKHKEAKKGKGALRGED